MPERKTWRTIWVIRGHRAKRSKQDMRHDPPLERGRSGVHHTQRNWYTKITYLNIEIIYHVRVSRVRNDIIYVEGVNLEMVDGFKREPCTTWPWVSSTLSTTSRASVLRREFAATFGKCRVEGLETAVMQIGSMREYRARKAPAQSYKVPTPAIQRRVKIAAGLALKSCARCGGDVKSDNDMYGAFRVCLQCGHMSYPDVEQETKAMATA